MWRNLDHGSEVRRGAIGRTRDGLLRNSSVPPVVPIRIDTRDHECLGTLLSPRVIKPEADHIRLREHLDQYVPAEEVPAHLGALVVRPPRPDVALALLRRHFMRLIALEHRRPLGSGSD